MARLRLRLLVGLAVLLGPVVVSIPLSAGLCGRSTFRWYTAELRATTAGSPPGLVLVSAGDLLLIGNPTSTPLTVAGQTVTAGRLEPHVPAAKGTVALFDANGSIVGTSSQPTRGIMLADPNALGGQAITLEPSDIAGLIPHNEVGWGRPPGAPAPQAREVRLQYGNQELRLPVDLTYAPESRYAGEGVAAALCEPANDLFVDPFGGSRSRFARWLRF